MGCRVCQKRFSLFVDQRLAPEEARRFEAHIAQCARCRGDLAQYRRFQGAMAAQPPLVVPSGLTARVMAHLPSEAPALGLLDWLQRFARFGAPAATLVALLLMALLYWRQPAPQLVSKPVAMETSMVSESMIESGDADDDELTGFVITASVDDEEFSL